MILMHVTKDKGKEVTHKQVQIFVLAKKSLWQCLYRLLSAEEVRTLFSRSVISPTASFEIKPSVVEVRVQDKTTAAVINLSSCFIQHDNMKT